MKVNINKIQRYQAGGYMIYQPLPLQPPMAQSGLPTSSSEQESEATEGVLDKQTIQKLLGQGLTNDVMQFSRGVENAYQQYSSMSDIEKSSVYGRQLRNMMKGDLGQVNALLRHKDNLTKAIASVESKDALGEIAITNHGLLIKDLKTNQIGEVGYAEYIKDYRGKANYKILTNAELIEEREYNPNLVMDENSYAILGNGVGMNKVKEEITKILSTVGSEKTSQASNSYLLNGENISPEVRKAAQQLVGMGPEGYYEVNTERSKESNENLLAAARDVMWTNLSNPAKSLLRAKAVTEGASAGDVDKVAREYAVSLLNVGYKNDVSESTTAKYDSKMTEDTGTGKGGGSGSGDSLAGNLNFWSLLASEGGDPQPVQVDYGDGDVITAYGFSPGVFISGGKPTGATSVRNIPELNSIIDPNSASIGGVKIPRNKLEAVVYEGNEVTRVRMPAMKDRTGAVVPDLQKAKQYNELVEKLKDIPTASAKEQLIHQYGFYSDGKGGLNPQFEADFIVFDGMINEKAMGGVTDQRLLREVADNEKEVYESLYRYNNRVGDDKTSQAGTGEDYGWFSGLFGGGSVYRGRVFMALRSDSPHIAARIAGGDPLSVPKAQLTPEFLGTTKYTR